MALVVMLAVLAGTALLAGLPGGSQPDGVRGPSPPPTLQPRATRAPTRAPASATASFARDASPASPTEILQPLLLASGGNRTMGLPVEEPAKIGGTLVIGVAAAPGSLNPVAAGALEADSILNAIFEPLVEADPLTLRPVGVLAEAWEVDGRGLVWTFYLRDGVYWHDGEAFTAEDVSAAYRLYLDPAAGHPAATELAGIVSSIEAVDRLMVRIETSERFADLPLALGSLPVIAAHIFDDVPAEYLDLHAASTGLDADLVIGTGPFRFESLAADGTISASANAEYWDGVPSLDRIIARPVVDQAEMFDLLRAGDLDVGTVAPGTLSAFEGLPIQLVDIPMLGFTMLGFNLNPQQTTLFQDERVRQALLLALDRQSMVDDARAGYADVVPGTFPPVSWAARAEDVTSRYSYDPGRARELLDQAGWTTGPDGVRVHEGVPLAFTIVTNEENEIRARYLDLMREQWAAVGIDARIVVEPFDDLLARLTDSGDYDAFVTGYNWDVTPGQSELWACASGWPAGNLTGYCNPAVDSLLVRAAREFDANRRSELYLEMQELVLSDLPVAILDFPRTVVGVAQRVHNLYPSGVNLYFNAETWWIE
jgi:peptide/nickel transport system substrate-binding protein